MVDGRQTRNLPGRKTDMKDCQWGALRCMRMACCGRASFPRPHIRRLQDYLRLRGDHIAAAAGHVQHMQKALERMNIKLHDVISSLTGASGLAVVRAILAGERDPQVLLGSLRYSNSQRQSRARRRIAARRLGPGTFVRPRASRSKLEHRQGSHRRRRSRDCGGPSPDAGGRRRRHRPRSDEASEDRARGRASMRRISRICGRLLAAACATPRI